MAGGKIIRIVGGKNSIECDNWTVYTDEFNASAGGKSQFTADDGIYFGEPKEPELKKGVFVRGWWSSDKEGKNKITEAFLGDKVFFHIETKNIPNGKYIGTMLYDDDLKKIKEEKDNNKGSDKIALGPKGGDDYKYLRYREVKDNKIVITILLEGIFENLIEEEEDKQIELFFACSYDNENAELPLSFNDYLKVSKKINYGGAFLFILTDELLPSGKIVRKVVVPPPAKIFDYFKSNKFEMFGMSPPNPSANISIGEHAFGLNKSQYLSGSSLPNGAPNIKGTPHYIDIKKAKAAGCKIYSTEEIVADLKRLRKQAPTVEAKARLDKVINAVSNIEKEVLIEGNIPADAIKSPAAMRLTKGLRVLNIIGIVITAYELEQATEKSVKQNSIKPIAAETIRQVGGWGSAVAGAKIGGIAGAAIGIETGPGAIITGAIGAIIFGTAGYFGADWIADQIDEN